MHIHRLFHGFPNPQRRDFNVVILRIVGGAKAERWRSYGSRGFYEALRAVKVT